MNYRTHFVAVAVLICSCLAPTAIAQTPAQPAFVWWEAEKTAELTNGRVNRFGPNTAEGKILSESARLSPGPATTPKMQAAYQVNVPARGEYNLWARKFWKHGPFKWHIADGAWRTCGRDVALHDSTFIRLHEGANWVFLGKVKLNAGPARMEIESIDNKGWFDSFLLISGPFMPAGRLKPGESANAKEPGWFAWEPSADPFADSPIDLRYLNEKFAGARGYVRREGNHFVLGDGTPVRFWLTQANLDQMQKPMIDLHARRLAKYGVNLVRMGFMDLFKSWRLGDTERFKQQLDRVHYTVASLKAQGIYCYFGHLFWDTAVTALNDNDLPGLKKGEAATTAMFFNEPLQEKYLQWVAALMTPKNPYTGLSLAADPAVAIIEVQNESNTLFWTLNPQRLPLHSRTLIQRAFAQFAAQRYGSIDAALKAWGDKVEGDAPADGCVGFLQAYGLTTAGIWQHPKRAADQIEFLTKAQYALYEKMVKRFADMGIRTMVAGSNWKTADPSNLGPLEYYSYTATDMVCKNEYFGPKTIKSPRGYAVDVGDAFVSISAMHGPEAAGALMTAQPASHPYLITENNWDNPNEYRAEFPFLVATYGRMAGIDAWSFFAHGTPLWDTGMGVWNTASPAIMGQFPAYALMFRRGDVVEGPPAVQETVNLNNLYRGQPIALPEIQYKDFVWKAMLGGDPKVDFKSKISPWAFFAGPVRLEFSETEAGLNTADLAKLIDEQRGRIGNTNGQLEWHYRKGFAQVNTPTSQGAAGFLKDAGEIALSDMTLSSQNEYGTLIAVSLDGKPLRESGRILVQAVTQDKPFGYKTEPVDKQGGVKITALGGYPFMVRQITAQVTLRGKAGGKVTVLDGNGYRTTKPVRTETRGQDLVIQLPFDALYTLVE